MLAGHGHTTTSRLAFVPTQPPIHWASLLGLFPGVKWLEREDDHSLLECVKLSLYSPTFLRVVLHRHKEPEGDLSL
jgi:hypothetical protein